MYMEYPMSIELAASIAFGIIGIICKIILSINSKERKKKDRYAKYLTIVRLEVSYSTTREKFVNDREICQEFLLLCIVRNGQKYLDGIIKGNSIDDSQDFIYYICKVAEEDPKQHEYLIR